jgi:hypothetical protein
MGLEVVKHLFSRRHQGEQPTLEEEVSPRSTVHHPSDIKQGIEDLQLPESSIATCFPAGTFSAVLENNVERVFVGQRQVPVLEVRVGGEDPTEADLLDKSFLERNRVFPFDSSMQALVARACLTKLPEGQIAKVGGILVRELCGDTMFPIKEELMQNAYLAGLSPCVGEIGPRVAFTSGKVENEEGNVYVAFQPGKQVRFIKLESFNGRVHPLPLVRPAFKGGDMILFAFANSAKTS